MKPSYTILACVVMASLVPAGELNVKRATRTNEMKFNRRVEMERGRNEEYERRMAEYEKQVRRIKGLSSVRLDGSNNAWITNYSPDPQQWHPPLLLPEVKLDDSRIRRITNSIKTLRKQGFTESDSPWRNRGIEEAERVNAAMMLEYRARSEKAFDPLQTPGVQPRQLHRSAP